MKTFTLFLFVLIILPSSIAYANTYLTENSSYLNIAPSFWTSLVSGDINNDNYSDLIEIGCTNSLGQDCNGYIAKVYLNNVTSFVENSFWETNLNPANYGSLALADVDNDGDLDLIFSGCLDGGGTISFCNSIFSTIYINNDTSFVENSTWKGDIPSLWKSSFAFGDVNNDGKLDLVASGSTDSQVISKVFINNGTSFKENSFWEQNLIGVFGSSTTLIDIDNDGKLDLLLSGDKGLGDYTTNIYLNNGTSFVENTWGQNLFGVELASNAWGDFDNNGRMDLSLTGHTGSDEHRIYNNTGTTLVEINSQNPGNLVGIYEAAQTIGDYNNDGKLDLFAAGREQYSTLYSNPNPASSYSADPEPNIFNAQIGTGAVWSDINNDGALDLILIGYSFESASAAARIYTNNITTKNTAPSPPSILNANYSNGVLNLSWNMGSDTETPALGLYYNLRVGTTPGGHQIVSGVYGGGDDNGYFGNMMQRRGIRLNLPNLSGAIYWSVQTIDTGLKAGAWAPEQTYTIQSQGGQSNETNAPNLTITSPSNNSVFTTASVSIMANHSDASNVTCSCKLNTTSYVSMSMNGAKNGTASHNYTSLSNGRYFVSVNCTDIYSNSVLKSSFFSVNVSAVVSDPAPNTGSGSGSSGGGGGGGGAGGLPANTPNTTKVNTTQQVTGPERIEIKAGEAKKIEVANSVVKEIALEVHETVGSVQVETAKVDQPAVPIIPAGSVYTYIEITPVNVSSINIKNASVTFDVEKSWLVAENINKSTVRLNRYNNGIWQQLETTLLNENSTIVTYKAVTPGFSLFAITGDKNIPYAPAASNVYYLPASIALVAVAAIGGILYYKKPKKA